MARRSRPSCPGPGTSACRSTRKTAPTDGERAFWPAHVHYALKGVAEEVVAGRLGMDMRHERIADAAERRRRAYYGERTSTEMNDSRLLLGAVMRDLKPGMRMDEVIDSIERHASADGPKAWQLPKGMDENAYRQHLVHRGALHVDGNGNVFCPIPSFRRHMMRKAGLEPPQTARDPGAVAPKPGWGTTRRTSPKEDGGPSF